MVIHVRGPASAADARDANVGLYLLADLIRRTAELGGLPVVVADDGAAATTPRDRALHADLRALNVHPALRTAGPNEPIDLEIITGTTPPGRGHPSVRAPRVTLETGAGASDAGPIAQVVARGLDPLALRLALLEQHYRRPTDLSWPAVVAADATLARWRRGLATWAMHPSVAMPVDAVAAVVRSLADDLDTPLAIALLGDLEIAPGIPDGARFEAFAHLDRALGLDLARDVGRTGQLSSGAASSPMATDSGS